MTMQSRTVGNVTVERTSWEDGKAREQAGEALFGWDTYLKQFVRMKTTGQASTKDLIDAGVVHVLLKNGVCFLWLSTNFPENTRSIINHTLKADGFVYKNNIFLLPEVDILLMATIQNMGIENGLGWYKRLDEKV